jgi:hypothetical protein
MFLILLLFVSYQKAVCSVYTISDDTLDIPVTLFFINITTYKSKNITLFFSLYSKILLFTLF